MTDPLQTFLRHFNSFIILHFTRLHSKTTHSKHTQTKIQTGYYALKDRFDHMTRFYPVKKSFYAREFPTSWRLIDSSLDESKVRPRPVH
jgi:hypothetical protein